MRTVGVLTGRVKKEEFEKAGADYVLGDASEVCSLLAGWKQNGWKGGSRSTKFQVPNTK
jgi:hypothetical protein